MRVSTIMTARPLTVGVDATLDEAMLVMDGESIRHLPVVREGALIGVLSSRDLMELTGWLSPRERELLDAPDGPVGQYTSRPVYSIGPAESVAKAVLRMATHKIGCLPVVEAGELIGIVTELDVLMGFLEFRRLGRIPERYDPPVEAHMETDVATLGPQASGEQLLALMKQRNLRHVPVLERGRLVGLVSDRDVRLAIGRGGVEGLRVADIMTEVPCTVGRTETLSEVAQVLVAGKFGALPVVEPDGSLCGIVALPDLFAACLEGFEAIDSAGAAS